MAPTPLVGSQDWKAKYKEKSNGKTPKIPNKMRKGLTKT
jgi:hypothetical protein